MNKTALTLENLKTLISKREKLYKDYPDEAVAAYNREIECTNAYNGRQVLELLQNADDALANRMKISLNEEKGVLCFFNDGDPFTYEGVKSIMVANLSNKVTSSYIGNKGLGFRSILNWAKKATIHSAGITISFSRKIAEDAVKRIGLDLDKIRGERNLSEDSLPFPVLGIPEISDNEYSWDIEWGCCIEIEFDPKKYLEDIKKQLKQINETVLLFLKHISTIEMPDGNSFSFKRGSDNGWIIKEQTGELPGEFQDKTKKEIKRYSVKVALPKDGQIEQGDTVLFNYLPTMERIGLPFYLHATVELESSRNHIIDSGVNRYILEKAADLIEKIALDALDPDTPSWRAYQLMTPLEASSSSVIEESLFKVLQKKRDLLDIYPTVSDGYCKRDEYGFFDNADCNYWQNLDQNPQSLCRILQPIPSPLDKFIKTKKPDFQEFCGALNEFSCNSSIDVIERAKLIAHLLDVFSNHYPDQIPKLQLFIDSDGNVIKDASVFTPKMGEMDYTLPSYFKLSFMHERLYYELIKLLKNKMDVSRIEKESDARCLARILKSLSPIADYDKSDISATLISRVNQLLESSNSTEEKKNYIKSMVSTLIKMEGETALSGVQLINQQDSIVKASELLLDTDYNRYIFGDINDRYVQKKEYWGFEYDDESYYRFMRLLGVNAWIKEVNGCDDQKYYRYLVANGCLTEEEVPSYIFFERVQNIKNTRILHPELLKDLNITKFILLLDRETELANGLEEVVGWVFKYKNTWRDKRTPFNYVRYQITAFPKLKNTVFDKDLVLSDDLNRSDLYQYSVPDSSIKRFLNDLQTDVSKLSDDELVEIINSLEQKKLDSSKVRQFYGHILQERGDRRLPEQSGLKLLCTDGQYRLREKVYYTDNTCLPEKIITELGLYRLSFPSRQGTTKVCAFFGISSPDQIRVKMSSTTYSVLSTSFSKEFERIKPFLLLFALNGGRKVSDEDTKKAYASALRKCSILLLESGRFVIQSSIKEVQECDTYPRKELDIAEYEFVRMENEFYVCINQKDSLDDLKKNPKFCNAFAEIIGMSLRLESRNDDFIYLLKDSEFKMDLDKNRYTQEELNECYTLMGLSREERLFWSTALELLDITVDPFLSKEGLEDLILSSFHELAQLKKSVDYYRWDTDTAIELLNRVEDRLGEEKMARLLETCRISLYDWYSERYRQLKVSKKALFEEALWLRCSNDKDLQKSFLQLLFDYDCLSLNINAIYQSLHFDPECELKKDISQKFNNIKLDGVSPIQHDNCYQMYEGIKEWPLDIKSLLYFQGNETAIQEYLKSVEHVQPHETKANDQDIHVSIVEPGNLTEGKSESRTRKRTTPIVHSKQADEKKELSGRDAEIKVRNYFVSKGIKYIWRSSYADDPKYIDDSIGYDFEYQENEKWRYLEVKQSSDNSFIMSENEFRVATEGKNSELYDIAIVHVSQSSIRFLKAFFTGKYTKSEKEYFISFGIQK